MASRCVTLFGTSAQASRVMPTSLIQTKTPDAVLRSAYRVFLDVMSSAGFVGAKSAPLTVVYDNTRKTTSLQVAIFVLFCVSTARIIPIWEMRAVFVALPMLLRVVINTVHPMKRPCNSNVLTMNIHCFNTAITHPALPCGKQLATRNTSSQCKEKELKGYGPQALISAAYSDTLCQNG